MRKAEWGQEAAPWKSSWYGCQAVAKVLFPSAEKPPIKPVEGAGGAGVDGVAADILGTPYLAGGVEGGGGPVRGGKAGEFVVEEDEAIGEVVGAGGICMPGEGADADAGLGPGGIGGFGRGVGGCEG